jgi:hypothetical protein
MHLQSVYGPFTARRVLVEMSYDRAAELFGPTPLSTAIPRRLVDAVEGELERIRALDPALADGPLAASAVAMALEIEHPFNSATSKSMCQNRLAEALRELRELAPVQPKKDGLDELAERRTARRSQLVAGGAGTTNKVRS